MSTKTTIVILLGLCFQITTSKAQSPDLTWKKAYTLAENFYSNGDYVEAAKHYEDAYNKKTSKLEYAYLAGKSYLLVRDYIKASEMLDLVKDEVDEDFKDARYLYAKSIKHQESYADAGLQLKKFASDYIFDDFDAIFGKVERDLEGCIEALNQEPPTIYAIRLSTVSTQKNDISPFVTSDALYYSSQDKETATIKKASLGGTEIELPLVYDGIECPDQYCGKFTANSSLTKAYFSACNNADLLNGCKIYYTERVNDKAKWDSPVVLPSYISTNASSSTDPNWVEDELKEILYFVSNRSGTYGGFDIWYSVKDKNAPISEYTLPTNVGVQINTGGDEIAPFYYQKTEELYFSSNGYINFGGFDIHKAHGRQLSWDTNLHLNIPYNSGGDDTYLFKDAIGNYYLSSNRVDKQKNTTTDDDLYFIESTEKNIDDESIVSYAKKKPKEVTTTSRIAENYDLDSSKEKIVESTTLPDNDDVTSIRADEQLALEKSMKALESSIYDTPSTSQITEEVSEEVKTQIENDKLPSESYIESLLDDEVKDNNQTTSETYIEEKSPLEENSISEPVIDSKQIETSDPIVTSSSVGFYCLQLAAVRELNVSKFSKVEEIYNLSMQKSSRGHTRVTIRDIGPLGNAYEVQRTVQSLGFPDAFIYKEVNGKRLYKNDEGF